MASSTMLHPRTLPPLQLLVAAALSGRSSSLRMNLRPRLLHPLGSAAPTPSRTGISRSGMAPSGAIVCKLVDLDASSTADPDVARYERDQAPHFTPLANYTRLSDLPDLRGCSRLLKVLFCNPQFPFSPYVATPFLPHVRVKSPAPLFPICGDPISPICQKSNSFFE